MRISKSVWCNSNDIGEELQEKNHRLKMTLRSYKIKSMQSADEKHQIKPQN